MNFSLSPTNHQDGQEWRSSSSAFAPKHPAFTAVVERTAGLCGVPVTFVEPPQVVRYLPGERYRPHMDSEGQMHRHWTLLLYLNDPGVGGATAFPLLKMKVEPFPRAALFWENLQNGDEAGEPLRRNYHMLHDGQAPSGTEPKYAVNIWVRNAEYVEGL